MALWLRVHFVVLVISGDDDDSGYYCACLFHLCDQRSTSFGFYVGSQNTTVVDDAEDGETGDDDEDDDGDDDDDDDDNEVDEDCRSRQSRCFRLVL